MSPLNREKDPLPRQPRQDINDPSIANMPDATWSRPRRVVIGLLLFVLLTLGYRGCRHAIAWNRAVSRNLGISAAQQENSANPSVPLIPAVPPVFQDFNGSALVPLEAHIMSKCPDARDCLHDLIVPAMERISDKVDFRLSFIGTYVTLFFVLYALE